ncbi:MAG: protein-(glutamine-N5) methyltransferase, release factor-specific, partial [Planctomycetota bacterium]
PPYVARDAMDTLHRSVREHEPTTALTDGDDGLSFYRTIGRDAPALLKADGWVFVEIGDGQATAVIRAVEQGGGLIHRITRRDRASGAERVLGFTRG